MAELGNTQNFEAARQLLKASLQKSKQVGTELDETGSRLREINQRLVPLEAEVREVHSHKTTYVRVRNQVDCAIGPTAAILRVYQAVSELEKALISSDPHTDLFAYLSLIRRLGEGLKFLASHSLLAIQWLEDVFELLEGDERLLNLKNSSRILKQLHGMEESFHMEGGLLSDALDKLENELRKLFLLTESTDLVPMASPLELPVSVIEQLHAIIERLKANDRLEKCVSLFVKIRVSNARRRLQALGLDYLDVKISDSDDMQSVENYIEQWGMHLELALKHIFDHEYRLSKKVFEKIGSDVWMPCFARISIESGIISFLEFGNEVTNMKKEPIKLLKLLDIFKVLNNLRMDFNRLYGSTACMEIQNPTRELVKKVVEDACDIFQELPFQVGSQRRFSPPQDGSVPRLVRFITDYCNQLLGEDYKPALTEVLTINQKWKQEIYQEGLLSIQFYNMMKEIGLNLDSWSKAYSDTSLSYLFMMNNHCHFSNLRGTKLGDMMGDTWLASHDQYKDYYAALYLKESWGKTLLPLVTRKGLVSISVSRREKTSTGLDYDADNKRRLKAFNEAFEESYEKQSNWVISDENLRRKVCRILVEEVVPTYRSYIESYRALVEQDASAGKYVKHTEKSLESKLSSLFQPKLAKFSSNKHVRLIGKLKNVVTNQFRFTLTAM
ncbi:exocyst complex component EXO70A1-like [Humulus lupulus]|uniref:exocyst complex component EXO70A1-like n=1 Tax=Humulus lupulus TaxID=3486 RepID=UPI002B40CDE9|nr:exocyst complex component EXO70A1-like [Humulus lupulus]